MKTTYKDIEILSPKNQLQLFGYDDYFNAFIKLFHKSKLPNTILLSGLKGSGKATFAYHFINYLLSYEERNKYSVNNFSIDPDNKSYKSLCNFTHPNFFLLENKVFEENIKIDDVKNILGSIKPDLTFILKVKISKALERLKKRKKKNRYDKFSKNFYIKAQNAFIKIAKKNKKRYFVLDNSKDSKETEKIILNRFIKVLYK